uniref:EGF-like domain-containing protein n=1 Tax=Oryzias latipes TaxID=8090 RepID=A0A3P9J8J0_ORYLA
VASTSCLWLLSRLWRVCNEGVCSSDVDECLQNPCSNSRCENTPGSYRCKNSELLCTDIDECRQSPCSNARCENTPGSYRCVCRPGYRRCSLQELNRTVCSDMDECAEPSRCPGQMCVNSAGSYRCVSCRSGYKLTNRQCTDINECLEGDFCFSGGECLNTPGSYMCVCSQGFTLSSNGTACMGESMKTHLFNGGDFCQALSCSYVPSNISIRRFRQISPLDVSVGQF